jgi:hypothetical protein
MGALSNSGETASGRPEVHGQGQNKPETLPQGEVLSLLEKGLGCDGTVVFALPHTGDATVAKGFREIRPEVDGLIVGFNSAVVRARLKRSVAEFIEKFWV